jgi:hypothetical protein
VVHVFIWPEDLKIKFDTERDSSRLTAASKSGRGHIGPLIPPSLRTLQKWIMISKAAASGMATQWRT